MPKKIRYVVKLPDAEMTRASYRTYTHAVCYRRHKEPWRVGFCGSEQLAKRCMDRLRAAQRKHFSDPSHRYHSTEWLIMPVEIDSDSYCGDIVPCIEPYRRLCGQCSQVDDDGNINAEGCGTRV